MKNILILQNKILHYRKALYNELSKYYNVTILHSGDKSVNTNDKYKEIITDLKKIGPFYLQSNIISEVRNNKYNVVISMLDLRWINNIFAMYLHNKNTKFIWWGAWITNSKIANFIRLYLINQRYNSILYTHEAKDDFIKLGVNEDKLFVANNTFDVGQRIKSYENKIKNSILFVGSLDARKQNDILIQAFSNISQKISPDISLTIIGAGIEKEKLEALVKKLNINNRVSFEGKITDTEVLLEYYKKAIVSVSFGQAGLSVLQSFGYGVPFLTKINAISGGEKTNIKNGINGVFCEDNIESLENILLRLCNDIDFSRELGKNAYDYYSKYCTIENMAQGFIDAIENTRIVK
jgi:glycosyltransferase involved in cell wall biosynthesis